MNQTEFKHISVLLNETIEGLAIKPDGIYVDGTMGGAGHGYEVLFLVRCQALPWTPVLPDV